MIIAFCIILALSAISKGLMDNLLFHWSNIRIGFIKNNPQYWNPAISYNNKYTMAQGKSKFVKWLLQGTLVFVTDGWHLMQFLFLNSVILSMFFYQPFFRVFENDLDFLVDFLIFRLWFGLVFVVFYNNVWQVKPQIKNQI